MAHIKKILLSALTLATLAGSAHATDPAPLSRAQMKCIRGEKAFAPAAHGCPNGTGGSVCKPFWQHDRDPHRQRFIGPR